MKPTRILIATLFFSGFAIGCGGKSASTEKATTTEQAAPAEDGAPKIMNPNVEKAIESLPTAKAKADRIRELGKQITNKDILKKMLGNVVNSQDPEVAEAVKEALNKE
jgi:hypothetical protein